MLSWNLVFADLDIFCKFLVQHFRDGRKWSTGLESSNFVAIFSPGNKLKQHVKWKKDSVAGRMGLQWWTTELHEYELRTTALWGTIM